ncbi:MAG TPA: hypothetical protein ENJ23_05395 [Bacteroidetes bacterium]|nr:hypothetical protein [Bacteroidota bacterium]
MIIGKASIIVALVAAVVAAISYWRYYQRQDESMLKMANISYGIMFAGVLFASALLMSQILAHNFQLNYVYSYSSRELSLRYLISTFWAGQEGTFLLWLIFSSIYGVILIARFAKKNPLVLFFLLLSQAYILIILIKKSPFAMIWDVHANAPFGFTPRDGAGLNPLLENPWMVIHPPVLFMGYSSTAVPFAFAMSAMVRKEFRSWVRDAFPWTVYTVLILGTGIMLGGYWAYVTLGWGGYWGWDPVENSSLIPWLLSTALLHGMIIQKRQDGLVKTNLALAGLAFIAMLWGSFLTRSGVLTDFSVHSFGESGLNLYLSFFVLLFAGLFLFLFVRSARYAKGKKFAEGIFSRESFMFFGVIALLLSAILTFVGTSSPIFTSLLGKASNVSTSYYVTIHRPIAILILLSLGIAPVLAWKVSEFRDRGNLVRGLSIAIVLTAIATFLGLKTPLTIFLFFLSVFVIVVNLTVAFRMIKKSPAQMGGYLAHAGVGLMIIGIITSTAYDRSEKITLPKGEYRTTSLGYQVKFVGFRPMPNGKDRVRLDVKVNGREIPAEAEFYFSDYTNSYMVSPFVKAEPFKDIYIAPVSFIPAKKTSGGHLTLHKGESKNYKGMKITFNQFIVGQHGDSPAMMVTADLTVTVDEGGRQKSYPLDPQYIYENGKFRSTEVEVPGNGAVIRIAGINASEGSVHLDIITADDNPGDAVDLLGVEVSEKPFIGILWLGTIIAILGLAISLYFRAKRQSA